MMEINTNTLVNASKVELQNSQIQGIGVYTRVEVKRGHPILTIDDSRQVTLDNPLREECGEYEHHCDFLSRGRKVLLKTPESHLNHSCSPNSFVRTMGDRRILFAMHDIGAGKEVTIDYSINSSGGDNFDCFCGSLECRNVIEANFFNLPKDWMLKYMTFLDTWFVDEHLDQVLKELIPF